MPIIGHIYHLFIPEWFKGEEVSRETAYRYKRIWLSVVLLTAVVSLAPLIFMTVLNVHQYQVAFRNELIQPISTLAAHVKNSLQFNFEERRAALSFIINEKSLGELSVQKELASILSNLRRSFSGFVDLGVIDSDGRQLSYAGPYQLLGKKYSDQDWFNQIKVRDYYISDVFMGFRGLPHFIIAVKHEIPGGGFYILRASIDIDFINEQLRSFRAGSESDIFMINHDGVLQTPSHWYGAVLEPYPGQIPRFSPVPEVLEIEQDAGQPFILGYAHITQSPFIFMTVQRSDELMKNWLTLRRNLFMFLAGSILLIILMLLGGATFMVTRMRDADIKRAQVFHNLEYTNKLASIGRLAAGVAHEINNPLAIINEKAGLLQDIIDDNQAFPLRDKFLDTVKSILKSVDRCSAITHRFLGFAKRMHTSSESIQLEAAIQEVIEFLGKEALYRNIAINVQGGAGIPDIISDRGQLQQVFLNILNNALASIKDGGQIDIAIMQTDSQQVAVKITDDGSGIPEEQIPHVFEPFYTTKIQGTGLGLSITYDIVKKLGGTITVDSAVGVGTTFTVLLPLSGNEEA